MVLVCFFFFWGGDLQASFRKSFISSPQTSNFSYVKGLGPMYMLGWCQSLTLCPESHWFWGNRPNRVVHGTSGLCGHHGISEVCLEGYGAEGGALQGVCCLRARILARSRESSKKGKGGFSRKREQHYDIMIYNQKSVFHLHLFLAQRC